MASAFGANTVHLADISERKMEFAKSFLGCATLSPDLSSTPSKNATKFLQEMGEERGVDVVLECTGVESSAQTGLHALAVGGTFVQIGLGKADQTLPLGMMCEKEVVVKTAFRYAPGGYDIDLELLAAGKVTLKPLISSTVPFERASEAWERTARGEGIKNLIEGLSDA